MTYNFISKSLMNKEVLFWKNNHNDINKKITENKTNAIISQTSNTITEVLNTSINRIETVFKKQNELSNYTRTENIKYGLINQKIVLKQINVYFNDGDIKETINPYCKYDFYGNNFIYELKSLRYSVNKYPTAIMNTSKLIQDDMVFLFQYTEQNNKTDLYYIQYDKELFKTFNTRYIKPFNRINTSHIVDIPIELLIKIKISTDKIELIKSQST